MYIVSALGLYILVSIFASGKESDARWKILGIAVGSGLLQAWLAQLTPGVAGLLAVLVLPLGFIAAALIFWCGVERVPAFKIVASYFPYSSS